MEMQRLDSNTDSITLNKTYLNIVEIFNKLCIKAPNRGVSHFYHIFFENVLMASHQKYVRNRSCQIDKFFDAGVKPRSPGVQNCRFTRTLFMNF